MKKASLYRLLASGRPTAVLCRVGALIPEIAGEPDSGEQISIVILDAATHESFAALTRLRYGRYSLR